MGGRDPRPRASASLSSFSIVCHRLRARSSDLTSLVHAAHHREHHRRRTTSHDPRAAAAVRARRARAEFARNPAPVLSLTAPSEPFNDFVNEDLHITQDETGDAPHYGFEPWRTMFRHHRLIYVLMADRVRTRGSGGTEYLEALFRLRTRGIDFIRTKVAATHPKVAEQMLASTAQAGQDMREMGMPSLPL